MTHKIDLTGKTALITGASRGIGAAVAVGLAEAGAHVVLMARTIGGLEAVDDAVRKIGGKATLMPEDLLAAEKLDLVGPTLAQRFGGLDIFIGNAGYLGTLGPVAHQEPRDWDKVMRTNVTANFRLIRSLDPLLRASSAGRAVFVTSGMAHKCTAYWGAYAVSKAALEAMVKTYAAETLKTDIRVNLLSPGTTDTAMLDAAYPGGYQGQKKKPEDVVPAFLDLVSPECVRHGEIVSL
jgi:NAD(P)-dependent dehydrogenase (short-subunit alcohol dehydrogenase family)